MAQSVKHPSFGFGLGRDLMVMGLSPSLGSELSPESVWDSLSLSALLLMLSPPPLSEINLKKKKGRKKEKSVNFLKLLGSLLLTNKTYAKAS